MLRKRQLGVMGRTFAGAPDSLQGALAAGLLGGGSRFLGVTEGCAHFLARELKEIGTAPTTQDGWDAAALNAVQKQRDIGKFVPGLGHPVHKQGYPRTPVLLAMARELGVFGSHLSLFKDNGSIHSQGQGKYLPL